MGFRRKEDLKGLIHGAVMSGKFGVCNGERELYVNEIVGQENTRE